MSIETNHRSHETVWTLQRVISVAASLVMISALGIISYNIADLVPATTAATPASANASAPAPTSAPVVTDAPPAPRTWTDLPPEVALAPLKDTNGASFKLAH